MPRPRQQQRFVQAKDAATGRVGDESFVVRAGDLFAAEHPIVRAYPHFFRAADIQRPAVEEMTAAPGEQRGAPDLAA